jgi:hypothetical protein
MKLDVRAAALAAGSIAALVYALCTGFCALVPEPTVVYLTTALVHFDVTGLHLQLTWESFVIGLLGAGVGTGVMAGATAWLYNRLARTVPQRAVPASQREVAAAGRAP